METHRFGKMFSDHPMGSARTNSTLRPYIRLISIWHVKVKRFELYIGPDATAGRREIDAGTANPTFETLDKTGRLFGFMSGLVPRTASETRMRPKTSISSVEIP